ncbi:MAG: hypothetical protein Fur0015_03770 [Ignavibacteriales bacterium]
MRIIILILLFVFNSFATAQNKDSLSSAEPKQDSISLISKSKEAKNSVSIPAQPKINKPLPKKNIEGENQSRDITKNIQLNFWSLIYFIFLFLSGYFISNLLSLLKRLPIFSKFPVLNSMLIYLKSFVWIIIVYLIISIFSDQFSFVLIGLILLAVVFISVASLRFLQNIIGGIYLNITNPFQKGDFIRIEKYEGEVQKIELRTTTLISETNSMVSVPNSLFLSVPVVNVNRGQAEQLITIEYEFPFEYSPNKIIKIIYESALSSPYSYLKYKPKVFFKNSDFQKKTRIYQLQIFVFDGKYENELQHSLNLLIANSIEVTFGKQR